MHRKLKAIQVLSIMDAPMPMLTLMGSFIWSAGGAGVPQCPWDMHRTAQLSRGLKENFQWSTGALAGIRLFGNTAVCICALPRSKGAYLPSCCKLKLPTLRSDNSMPCLS